MLRYETLLLTVPEITLDEASAVEAQVQKIVRENKGTMVSFERWGKMLLAYPVQDKDYGVYFLARFEVAQEHVEALLEAVKMLLAVKLNETIMRYMLNRLDSKALLEYQRPESLEDTPRSTEGVRDGRSRSDRSYNSQDMSASMPANNDTQGKEVHGKEI